MELKVIFRGGTVKVSKAGDVEFDARDGHFLLDTIGPRLNAVLVLLRREAVQVRTVAGLADGKGSVVKPI
jgi:hypothetical protein